MHYYSDRAWQKRQNRLFDLAEQMKPGIFNSRLAVIDQSGQSMFPEEKDGFIPELKKMIRNKS